MGTLSCMAWPTWDQAAIAAVISGVVAITLRRSRPGRARIVEQGAVEFALLAALYAVWRVARQLPLAHDDGAIERARQIVDLQNALHFPTELSLQQFVLRNDWLGWPTTLYYATLHVPALVVFLVWLFLRHREHYAHWRNGLAILTGACLVIRFVRVAPPRFLVDLGYEDLSEIYGPSIYGPVGTGVSDQFAAMPSIHVGWAAVVSFGIVAVSTSRWRWVFMLHVVITSIVVSASGNHWWLDGIVAIALLWAGLAIDTAVRGALSGRLAVGPNGERVPAPTPGPVDVPVDVPVAGPVPVAFASQSSTSSGGDGSTIS